MPGKDDHKLRHEPRPGKFQADRPAVYPTEARRAAPKDNRAAVGAPPHSHGVAGLAFRTYLDNCDLPDDTRARAFALYQTFSRVWGKACPTERFGVITLLAHQPPHQPLERFSPHHAGSEGWTELMQHVLGPWPVPRFLLHALHHTVYQVHRTPWEIGWVVDVARALGEGRSLTHLAGTTSLPTPLTRRMVHLFVRSPSGLTPIEAIREAQVAACGGPAGLGKRLAVTLLGQLQGPDPHLGERWWACVIGWFARHPEAAQDDVDATMDCVRALRARSSPDAPFSLDGRTPKSLRALVAQELERAAAEQQEAFPISGYQATILDDHWEVVELRTPVELLAEGQELHHCAGMYTTLCARGVTSVWSVRHDGARRLTIEVVRAAARVAQVRGFANRAPTAEESDVVRRWAEANDLQWVS